MPVQFLRSPFSVLRSPFSVLRSPVNPRPVHRLKLNTVFRLTFILPLGGAGLTACANLQTVSYVERLKTDAEQGYAAAEISLGRICEEGRGGVPQDDEQTVQWARKAAAQGYAAGQMSGAQASSI